MSSPWEDSDTDFLKQMDRRSLLAMTAGLGGSLFAAQNVFATQKTAAKPSVSGDGSHKKFDMKKSINLWATPYPEKWTLKQCFQLCKDAGFDAVEVNFDIEGELSAETTDAGFKQIRSMAEKIGIEISGVCSFLYWPYSLTANDPEKRAKGLKLGLRMIEAAKLLGTDNLLVVPGAVYIPWKRDEEPVANDICHRRATKAIRQMVPVAEKAKIHINLENIFANGFLFSPDEMNRFTDQFKSKYVNIHFDTGNIMEYQFPEHWVPILGKRIKNIHLKEFDKKNAFDLNAFRTLLDGSTNWPAVIQSLDKIGYRGYLTFEYFHPFPHYPEALLYSTSDALDRMLGRKS